MRSIFAILQTFIAYLSSPRLLEAEKQAGGKTDTTLPNPKATYGPYNLPTLINRNGETCRRQSRKSLTRKATLSRPQSKSFLLEKSPIFIRSVLYCGDQLVGAERREFGNNLVGRQSTQISGQPLKGMLSRAHVATG